MPLPASASQWPPASLAAVYEDIDIHDGWFTGQVGDLAHHEPAGGFLNSMKARLYRQPGFGQQAKAVHVPVASAISRMSASILFGEMFKAEFVNDDDSDDKNTSDGRIVRNDYDLLTKRITELLDDHAHAAFMEAGEFASAHGGSFIRVSWDRDINPDGAFLSVRAADTAVPTFRFGRLVNVIFWDVLSPIAGQKYTMLEMHEKGKISYGLYQSDTNGILGRQVPLAVHPETLGLSGLTGLRADSSIETGSDMLTAVYLPNTKPNRRLRKDPVAAAMGRSDYDGATDLFAMLDNVMTSWERDFRLGKTRVMVPKNMLKIGQPGQGAAFDPDQELFVETGESVGAMNADDGGPLQVIQPDIRDEEHQRSAEYLFERIYSATGYSGQSFGESGDMAKTATEVSNREKTTLQTRAAKVIIARPVIIDLLSALLDVDYFVFPDRGVDRKGLVPNVEFPDAVGEDAGTLAGTLQTLTLAEAISTKEKVRRLNPDWDDIQVDAEVAAIKQEYNLQGGLLQPVGLVGAPSLEPVNPLDPETAAAVPVTHKAPGQQPEVPLTD